MTKLAKMAGRVLPFAHLLGIKADKADGSSDEDEDKKKDAAKKAESDEEDDSASADDQPEPERKPDEDPEKKDGKKSKKAEGQDGEGDGDGDEEEDEEEKKPSAAVLRDRARCARIIAHGIQTGTVRQAGVLAFDTNLSASAAMASLDASKADAKSSGGLSARMAGVPQTVVRPDAGRVDASDPKAVAAQILAATAKARGEKV